MGNTEIIGHLWQAANLITGFAAVQALAFSYACARKDFGDAINTRRAKRTIMWIFGLVSIGYCLAIAWCAYHQADLDPRHSTIFLQAAVGRVLFVIAITAFTFLILYARQIFSKQSLRG